MDATSFWAKYQAEYVNMPFTKSQTEIAAQWAEFCADVSPFKLEALFDAVANTHPRGRPGLRIFKSCLAQLSAPSSSRHFAEECGLCEGLGLMLVLGWKDEKGWHLGIGGEYCVTVSVPCLCSVGKKRLMSDVPSDRLQPCFERLDKCKQWALGMIDEAKQAETSYPAYIARLAREHNRQKWGGKRPVIVTEVLPKGGGVSVKRELEPTTVADLVDAAKSSWPF